MNYSKLGQYSDLYSSLISVDDEEIKVEDATGSATRKYMIYE